MKIQILPSLPCLPCPSPTSGRHQGAPAPQLKGLGPSSPHPPKHCCHVELLSFHLFPPEPLNRTPGPAAGHVWASQGALHCGFVYFCTQFRNICSDIFWGHRQEENEDISQVWGPSASVIGKQNGWVASPFVKNISFESEVRVMVPRGYIVCKQVSIKGKSWEVRNGKVLRNPWHRSVQLSLRQKTNLGELTAALVCFLALEAYFPFLSYSPSQDECGKDGARSSLKVSDQMY